MRNDTDNTLMASDGQPRLIKLIDIPRGYFALGAAVVIMLNYYAIHHEIVNFFPPHNLLASIYVFEKITDAEFQMMMDECHGVGWAFVPVSPMTYLTNLPISHN